MKLMDYHNHHSRCGHALGSIEEYIRVAIDKNLSEIGIADHFPFETVWNDPNLKELLKTVSMSVEEFPVYIQEIKDLRKKYQNKIAVKISTEVGFVNSKRYLDMQKKVLEPFMDDFDYLLGGIHELIFDGPSFVFFTDGRGSEILGTYGEEKIHMEYIKKMSDMVESGFFDIIAHLDNHRFLWTPNEPEYSEDVWKRLMELLDRIKSKGMAVEINTSGTLKGAISQLPSDDIVKKLIQKGIPLTLSSDAHRPEYVGYQFLEFIEKAKPWGLTHLCSYENRKQILTRIK